MRSKQFFTFATTSNTFIAIIVLLVGLSATLVSYQEARQTVDTKITNTLNQAIDDTNDAFEKRISVYEEILRGGAGQFTVRQEVISRSAFSSYVSSLEIRKRFPGLQAIGFSLIVHPNQLASHEAAVRAEGFPDYSVRPAGQRDVYTAIIYAEPFDERNQRAFGYDMYSDATRREAMDAARDTGLPTISDTVTLVQETDQDRQAGFLYFMPVYFGPSQTLAERQANIRGFVYAPVRIGDLMKGIFDQNSVSNINIKVYDSTEPSADHLIYQNNQPADGVTVSRPLQHGNHTWTIQASGGADVLSPQESQQPFMIIVLGGAGSMLLAAFIYIVMRSRARELAFQKQLDVQSAKDELLSLASHQLRTPATGVKQYLGIVLEGYTGKITKEQNEMLRKAYTSNERQLEIVNQLLHVTRLETGRLSLRFNPVDVGSLLKDVAQEQRETIQARHQTLKLLIPKQTITIDGDEQYLRMAVENLLSNASKYTHNQGDITVSVVEAPDRITLSFSDTGVGIDPLDYHKLFQKFSRIDNELSIQAGGSGIGLYLTKEIIELHGGSISVDSDRETGSTFTISLPKTSEPSKS